MYCAVCNVAVVEIHGHHDCQKAPAHSFRHPGEAVEGGDRQRKAEQEGVVYLEGRLRSAGRSGVHKTSLLASLDDADCPPRAASSIRRCLPDACVMTQRGISRYGSPLAYRLSWHRFMGGVQNPSLWSFVDCSRTKESVEPDRTPAIVAALCSSQPASTSEWAIASTGWWGKTP